MIADLPTDWGHFAGDHKDDTQADNDFKPFWLESSLSRESAGKI